MKFAVLTGGGDSSGINDFLYFLHGRLSREGHSLVGVKDSWQGLVQGELVELDKAELEKARFTPGTLLGTKRKNPIKDGQIDQVLKNLEANEIDALIAMGGDDTLGVAAHLAQEGFKVIGVPQTIDNDLAGTDYTLGYATAIWQGAATVNSIINSNIAHDRDMIVEVMGRDAGWLSLSVALNTPACALMVPEGAMSLEEMIEAMQRYKKETKKAGLAIVSEGIELPGLDRSGLAKDAFGNLSLEGVSHEVGARYEAITKRAPRVQVLGYLLRGGQPLPQDMELAYSFANYAIDLILQGETGRMVGIKDNKMDSVPITDIMGVKKYIPRDYLLEKLKLLA